MIQPFSYDRPAFFVLDGERQKDLMITKHMLLQDAGRTDDLLRCTLAACAEKGPACIFIFLYRCRCSFDNSDKHSRPMIHRDEFGSRAARPGRLAPDKKSCR